MGRKLINFPLNSRLSKTHFATFVMVGALMPP